MSGKTQRSWLSIIAAISLLGGLAPGAGAASGAGGYRRPGITDRVSVASDGSQLTSDGAWGAESVSMSADGRFVRFETTASNVVPGDTNDAVDDFVHDRETGTTERVSIAPDGTEFEQARGNSINADGRYVAFIGLNPTAKLTRPLRPFDVYVRDRERGTTELVSVASDGTPGNGMSSTPYISGDGRFVAFWSDATNLVGGDTNDAIDVFVHDRETGTTERVSIASDGSQGDGGRCIPADSHAISADGRFVAFTCSFGNLAPGDTNNRQDVFVRDRHAGTTERVSVRSDETELSHGVDWGRGTVAISADGRFVAFESPARVVPTNTNQRGLFVRDRETGVTERVSVRSDGTEFPDLVVARGAGISADGRYVAFWAWYREAGADTYRAFVHDRAMGTTERLSVASDGTEGDVLDPNFRIALSSDARYAAFTSHARNLVPGDTNNKSDAFVRDRGPETGIGALTVRQGAGQHSATGWATFTGAAVAAAEDSPGDGDDDAGAEITAASVIHRPELEDLLIRIDLASLPITPLALAQGPLCAAMDLRPVDVSGGPVSTADVVRTTCAQYGGTPGTVYGLRFHLAGTAYEVQILPADATTPARAALYECTPGCSESATLSGAVGTTGPQARVSLPLDVLGVDGAAELTQLEASVVPPASVLPSDSSGPADTLALPDAHVEPPRVELGIAPASASEADVDFSVQAELVEGRYSGSLDASSLAPDAAYAVWARACLGQTCGASSADVPGTPQSPSPSPTLGPPTPIPTPTQPSGERGTYPTTPDDPFFGPGEDIDPVGATRYGEQWGPQKIGAPEAWQEDRSTGSGVTVAVLDTGVDLTHPDLRCTGKLEVVSGSDLASKDSSPDDENGHGTHVAGIIGACTNNGTGIAGVAPDATIMPIRVLNASGRGSDAQLIAGINRAVEGGTEVVNMSLGYPPGKEIINDVSGIDAAIEAAAAAGVVIVASAGNDSFPLCEYPALAEDVICVGATDSRDNKSWYSTFANKMARGGPAVVAPGGAGSVFCDLDSEDILSLYAVDKDSDTCDGRKGYANLSGTSMAAPHVAGVAALVYDRLGGARSTENAQQVINALTSTAVDLGPPGYDPVYGSGRVDALAAVQSIPAGDPDPTPTPTATTSASPSPTGSGSASPSPSESPQPDVTDVSFTEGSATSGQHSDETRFEARLTDANGDPIKEKELTFDLMGESSRNFSATTDENGVAAVTPKLEEKPGPYQLTVRYDGNEEHAGDADTTSFVIEREESALDLSETKGKDKALVARLSDGDTSATGIAGRTIDFYAGQDLIGSATTGDDGVATFQPPEQKGKKQPYEARFEGDDFFLAASDASGGKGGKGGGGNGGGNGGGGGRGTEATYAGKVLLM